jgi:hypothetical protein
MTADIVFDFIVSVGLFGIAVWALPHIYHLYITATPGLQLLLISIFCILGAMWMALIFPDEGA